MTSTRQSCIFYPRHDLIGWHLEIPVPLMNWGFTVDLFDFEDVIKCLIAFVYLCKWLHLQLWRCKEIFYIIVYSLQLLHWSYSAMKTIVYSEMLKIKNWSLVNLKTFSVMFVMYIVFHSICENIQKYEQGTIVLLNTFKL